MANNYRAVFQAGQCIAAGSRPGRIHRVLTGTVTFPAGTLVNGANQITLTPVNVSGAPHDEYAALAGLAGIDLSVQRRVSGPTSLFNNPTAGTWRYRVTNSPSATPWVLRHRHAVAAQAAHRSQRPTPTSGTYTLTWQQATTAANRFLVVPDAEVRQPAAVQMYVDAGLLNTNQQVDYLIISHSSLSASVQPLAAMHAASGLSVKIVDVRDIYDAFSDGSVSAKAIRDYLAYVYAHYPWPAPTYVLLVGDGTVDFRGYKFASYGHANLIPPYMGGFDAWAGAALSDNAYTLLQGNDLLGEMIISRLPVNNPAETQTVVNKTVNYASTFPADRAHSTLWIADRPDNDNPLYGTQFHMASDETIAELAPGFSATRVYYCNPTIKTPVPAVPWIYTTVTSSPPNPPGARGALVSNFSLGNLLVYFTGHGSTTVWGKEFIYYSGWVKRVLSNGPALPYLLISSCDSGYFADPRAQHHGRGTAAGRRRGNRRRLCWYDL